MFHIILAKFVEPLFCNFRANFLQLDVFHRELSFERVRQQRAFQVESLLSEVGGFLGLLLGASLLTVFELLDHLIITFGYSRNGQ